MTTYVLTAIGDDRPGLVAALAAAVDEHGGSWVDSQLEAEVGLAVEAAVAEQAAPPGPARALRLRLLGQDRTGMVREVTTALRSQGATIDGLRSWTREAPEGGGMLFEAEAELRLPTESDEADVREALETIAAELMVDLELDAPE